jgi:multidrug transporter EmrE-like cation transporter
MKYLLLLLSMAMAVTGQFLFKKGLMGASLSFNFLSILKIFSSLFVLAGLVTYGLSTIVWLFVLKDFPLSVAYPSLALTYVIITIISVFFLGESVNNAKILGLLIIIFGVYLINRA